MKDTLVKFQRWMIEINRTDPMRLETDFEDVAEMFLEENESVPHEHVVMWQKVLPLLQEIKAEIEYWHMDYLEDDKENGWQRVHKKIDIFIAEFLST